jgi:hypothetical protein
MAPYGATVAKIFTVCMGSIQKTRVPHTIPKECHRCKKNAICQYSGKRIFLPRILLCLSDGEMFPFQFKMKHIPIRLSFAMTVNKAQGRLS